mgnify:CR=1 FL=1
MNLFTLIVLSFGHIVIDLHLGAVPTLMLYMRDAFSLGYAQVGLIILVSNFSSSVIQPLFGLYSDRTNLPWLMPLGIGLATLGMSLAGVMPYFPLVIATVFISGIGVAAYHPEGAKISHFAAGDRRNSAMALFSVGGNLGFSLGPILAALLLGTWGLTGSLGFLIPGLATTLAFYLLQPRIMKATSRARKAWQEQKKVNKTLPAVHTGGLVILIIIVILRSWVQYGLISYLPFYYTDFLGGEKHIAAALVSIFLVAGAIGTLIGGPLADRFGTKKHIAVSMGLMFPLLYLLLNTGGGATVAFTALAGAVLISTFSPTLVMGQQYLPHHIGLASGLMTGLAVGLGGLGVPILGIFADKFGVDLVLKILAVMPLAGFPLALFLPRPPGDKTTVGADSKIQAEQSI